MSDTKRKRPKLLSDHDVQEVVKFQQYLGDKQIMTRNDFHRKYQEYEGLRDAELQRILAPEVTK